MSVTNCTECRSTIDSRATICPHCLSTTFYGIMREEHNKVSSIITGACAFVGAMILWNYNFIIGAIVGGLIGAVIQYNRSMSFDAEFTNKYGE